jgi:hypothetical protein
MTGETGMRNSRNERSCMAILNRRLAPCRSLLDRLCGAKHFVWLGATDHDKDDAYVWLNGSAVDTKGFVLDHDGGGAADVLCCDAGSHNVIDWYSGGRLFYVCEWD